MQKVEDKLLKNKKELEDYTNKDPDNSNTFTPTFHIFKDKNSEDDLFGNTVAGIGTYGNKKVVESIQAFAKANAFKDGGTLIGHSAGVYNISEALQTLETDNVNYDISRLNVLGFGGVHEKLPVSKVKSWKDFYNEKDWADTAAAQPGAGTPASNFDPIADSSKPEDIDKYRRVTNDSNNDQWNALNTDSVMGKKAHHNFLTEYSDGYRKYQYYTMSDISIDGDGPGIGIAIHQTN